MVPSASAASRLRNVVIEGLFRYNPPAMTTTAKPARQKSDPEKSERLKMLVEGAKTARLSPAEEDEATQCLREQLETGRAGVPDAVEAILVLPWSVGVSAVGAAWPELKPTARKLLLAALEEQKSEAAKRVRLSLARGLFPQDAGTAAALALAVCAEMRAEGAALSAKDRQTFGNVLIGKGKPWLQHFPVAEWKPEEADLFIACAVETCFAGPCAPFTQLALLSWIAKAGRLNALSEESLHTVATAIKRWNPRFRKQLRAELPEPPAPIAEALGPQTSGATADEARVVAPAAETRSQEEMEREDAADAEDAEDAATAGSESAAEEPAASGETADTASDTFAAVADEDAAAAATTAAEPTREVETREDRRSQPAQSPRGSGGQQPSRGASQTSGSPGGGFDLHRTLRQIEAHVTDLRKQLHASQSALRQARDERGSRGRAGDRRGGARERDRETGGAAPAAVDVEELQRHNRQLEQTVADLRQQLEEIASDHEDQATAMRAHGGEPATESEAEQFKVLLGIKLRELYAEFRTLRSEPADDVLRQHYGDMLAAVFEILLRQDVPIDGQPEE